MFNNPPPPPENRPVYEIMWENMVQSCIGVNTPHNPSTDILHSPAYECGTDSEFRNFGN